MAPIGPGFTVGAIFVLEKNTLSEFAAGGRGGLAAALYGPAQSRRAHAKRRRAELPKRE